MARTPTRFSTEWGLADLSSEAVPGALHRRGGTLGGAVGFGALAGV